MTGLQNVPLCVDGRMLGAGGTGVATYARAVAAAQRQLTDAAFVLEDGTAARRADRLRRWLRALLPAAVPVRLDDGRRLFAADLFRLAQVHLDVHGRLLTVRPPFPGGIMHWTYPLPLRMAGWRNVYTVHDAIPLVRPDLSPIDPRRHARLLRLVASSADALVTVSAAAGAEIAAALSLPAGRIADCSQPVALPAATGDPPGGLARGAYLLVLGSVEPRKNIAVILASYRASGVALPLVVAGPRARGQEALERQVAATRGARRLDYVDASAIPALVAGARALVMPSLAEGFGLPVAEAMALGTPVITAAAGALAETAGGAALAVDPDDVGAIAAALARVVHDDALCAALAAAGRVNAARFAPARFTERLASLYAGLLAGPAGRL